MTNLTQVSHEQASEIASAFVEEVTTSFGEDAITQLASSKLLLSFSRGFATGHAAAVARNALAETPGVQAPIPVSTVDVVLEEPHPVLFFSDYVGALAAHDKLENLTGGSSLCEFWGKWQALRPHHPIFSLPADDVSRTIPIYLIADEGRGFKKSAIMVLGSEPVLGNGCEQEDDVTASESLKMNFTGNTFKTRQLFSVMVKKHYSKDPTPLQKLLDIWSDDLRSLFTTGLRLRWKGGPEQTWRIAVIGLKGDWPALDKLGRLYRHFRREAYPFGQGICHLCMANTSICPSWHEHDFTTAPWVRTIATATKPFLDGKESCLTLKIPMEVNMKANFFLVDLFHTCHKGVHADLAGSAIDSLPALDLLYEYFARRG